LSHFNCDEYSANETLSPQPIFTAPSNSPSSSSNTPSSPSYDKTTGAAGPSVSIMLQIYPGSTPLDVGWRISSVGPNPNNIVAFAPAGTYIRSYALITEQIDSLQPDTDYELTIIDKYYIGGIGGYAAVYLGSEQPSQDNLLAYIELFYIVDLDEVSIRFRTSQNATVAFPTASPSIPPSFSPPSDPTLSPAPTTEKILLFVQLTTDYRPINTGWRITNSRTEEVLVEIPPTMYRVENTQFTDSVLAEHGEPYIFEIISETKFFGDVLIVVGNTLGEDAVVGYMRGVVDAVHFVASFDSTIRVYPTQSPTVSIQPSVLTVSPAPTQSRVLVNIRISSERRNPRISFILKSINDNETIFETPLLSLDISTATSFDEYLKVNNTYEMSLITPRRIVSFWGTITVYLASKWITFNRVIAWYNGTGGNSFRFITSENEIISPPTAYPQKPSMAPSSPSFVLPAGSDAVFLQIKLDRWYEDETSWAIYDSLDREIASELNCESCEELTQILYLRRYEKYSLLLVDTYGDGLQNEAFVYLGTSANKSNVLLHYKYPQDSFEKYWTKTFDTSTILSSQEQTQAPSSSASSTSVPSAIASSRPSEMPSDGGLSESKSPDEVGSLLNDESIIPTAVPSSSRGGSGSLTGNSSSPAAAAADIVDDDTIITSGASVELHFWMTTTGPKCHCLSVVLIMVSSLSAVLLYL